MTKRVVYDGEGNVLEEEDVEESTEEQERQEHMTTVQTAEDRMIELYDKGWENLTSGEKGEIAKLALHWIIGRVKASQPPA